MVIFFYRKHHPEKENLLVKIIRVADGPDHFHGVDCLTCGQGAYGTLLVDRSSLLIDVASSGDQE